MQPAMRRCELIIMCALSLAAQPANAAAGIFGLWATGKNNGRVLIEPCGVAVCGRVIDGDQLRANPNQTDVHNSDPEKRARHVKGLVILAGYSGGPSRWQGGSIYDPQTGDEFEQFQSDTCLPGYAQGRRMPLGVLPL